MRWDALQRDLDGASMIFVYDDRDRDREKLCALRKLPACLRFGFDVTTYPKSWRKLDQWSTNEFEFTESEYRLLDDIPDRPTFDLVAITDQFYEDEYPIFSLTSVIDEYTTTDNRLLIAGDDEAFQPAGARRPLSESPTMDVAIDYRDLFAAFEDRYQSAGLRFPLRGSRNLFLQDNAMLYEIVTGHSLETVRDVFYALPDAPYLPLWEPLTDIFTTGTQQGTRLLDQDTQEGLAKWLRRRVELDYHEGLEIASHLNNLARRRERLFNPYRRLNRSELDAARDTAQSLEVSDTDLRARYQTWLTRGPQ